MTIFIFAVIAGVVGIVIENIFHEYSQSHRRF